VFVRSIAIGLLALGMSSGAAEPELGRPFDMKPSEIAMIDGLQIAFEGISEDSRCPAGVQCAWAGDAVATFMVERPPGAAAQLTLHTNGRYEREFGVDQFVVRLEDVKPYPKDGVTIAPDDYRATVVVRRR
jgi:hypothetical protein